MKMKKLISILAAGTMTMGLLAGCGSSSESTEEDTSGQAAQEDSADEGSTDAAASDEAETSGSGNVLIAYYSATGNTEAVANYIADATGGDLFELEPVEPYTDDDLNYNDENSRVSQEYADESLRDVELVSATVEGFDEYENIFVGYPIWWQVAAWPVNQFIENNDFTGKR